MSEKLSWIFELIDKISGPARAATDATTGFEKQIKKVEAQIDNIKKHPLEFKKLKDGKRELRELQAGSKSFAERFEEMGASIKRVGFVQNLMLAGEAFHVAFEAGSKVVEVVADIGKEMIGAAGQAERTKISFTALLGETEGSEMVEYLSKVAKVTEATSTELDTMGSRLLTIGFDAKEIEQVLPASLDIAAFLGGGVDKAEAAAQALSRIKTTGEISKRSLGALGLEWTKVMAELRTETGLSEKGVKEKLASGQFGPQALHAVLQSIANKEGGVLGATAEKMGGSLESRLKKLRDVPDEIFKKWATTPGFKAFSDAIGNIVKKLDPEGPNGKKIFGALDKASMKVVELVSKFAEGDGIDRFASGVTYVLENVDKIPAILDKVITVSEVIGTIWAGSQIVGAMSSLVALFPAIATGAGVATAAILPLAAPLIAGAAAIAGVTFAVKEFYDVIKANDQRHQFQKDQGIEGKSIEGMNIEIQRDKMIRDQRRAERAMGSSFADVGGSEAPAIPAKSRRAQPGGGGDQHVNVGGIHVTVPPGANADEIAGAVGAVVPGAVQQGLERMAVSSGAM